jgi:uncharacterized protein YbaP (TraB family)
VLEIADPADESGAREAFLRWDHAGAAAASRPGAGRARRRDARRLAETRLVATQFATLEDWAAALTLAFALEAKSGFDPENGADRALQAAAKGRPVVGLETLEGQLGMFDGLPAREQRTMLAAVVADSGDAGAGRRLVEAWARGDIAALDREAKRGMLADPRLREVLLVARNRDWARRVAAMLEARRRPFVAVGAAHVIGTDGLPALLAAQGYAVRRCSDPTPLIPTLGPLALASPSISP